MSEKEKKLEREVAIQEAVLESTADAILVVNKEGEIVAYNENFVDMWGVSDTIMESRDDSQALAHVKSKLKDPEGFMERVYHLYNNPERSGFDTLEFTDGRVVERFTHPYSVDGEIQGRVWSFHDVTYYREVEKKLERSNAMFKTTVNATADAVCVTDEEGNILFCNEKFRNMFGLSEGIEDVNDALEEVKKSLQNPDRVRKCTEALYTEDMLDQKAVETFEMADGRTIKRISKPFSVEDTVRGRVCSYRYVDAEE